MNKADLRRVADFLWDGEPEAVRVLGQLRQFKRSNEILFWLVHNRIRGKALIDFFNDAAGDETRGVLQGVKRIYNYIDATPFDRGELTVKDLE